MGKINIQFRTDRSQRSVSSIEHGIRGKIIGRSEPFALEYPPQSFSNIQMWGIWRQKEEKKPTLFPYLPESGKQLSAIYACVVKNHKRIFLDTERESVKEINNFVCRNALICGKSFITVVSVNHSENVEPVSSLRWDKYILTAELPAIRHISLCANMTFITEIKVNQSVFCLTFEFLQLLGLVRIELWRGLPLWTFSYTSISRTNTDKKALNVLSLACLPDACCHASLAFCTLCLSCSMALRTASSSEQSMIGLRPRPGRVSSPDIPSITNRLIHELTDICVISVRSPTSFDFKPFDFRRIARQRIRYAWLLPLRKPSSNCRRSLSVSCITLIFAITICIYDSA